MTKQQQKAIQQTTPLLSKVSDYKVCVICERGTHFIDVEGFEEGGTIASLIGAPAIDVRRVHLSAILSIGVRGTAFERGKKTSMTLKGYKRYLAKVGGKEMPD